MGNHSAAGPAPITLTISLYPDGRIGVEFPPNEALIYLMLEKGKLAIQKRLGELQDQRIVTPELKGML